MHKEDHPSLCYNYDSYARLGGLNHLTHFHKHISYTLDMGVRRESRPLESSIGQHIFLELQSSRS